MKPIALALALASSLAFAQAKTDYTLNAGAVHFHVPGNWTAIMEKADGDPQAVIFQVPDPATQGTEDTASVTIKTRSLKSGDDFQGFVTDAFGILLILPFTRPVARRVLTSVVTRRLVGVPPSSRRPPDDGPVVPGEVVE